MSEVLHSQMPFAPVWREDCRVLILGSHPSVLSKQHGFYYMNPQNRFWPLMSVLLGEDYVQASAATKTEWLLAHRVGLYDVVGSCDIIGSQDASITHAQPTDLVPLVTGAPIAAILLNGQKASREFALYFSQFGHLAHDMPSTSPANARMRLDDLVESWRVLLEYV